MKYNHFVDLIENGSQQHLADTKAMLKERIKSLMTINPKNRHIGSYISLRADGAHYTGPWAQLMRDWHLTDAEGNLLPSNHETKAFRQLMYDRIKTDPRFINAYTV